MRRFWMSLALGALTASACHHKPAVIASPTVLQCFERGAIPVTWTRADDTSELDRWCAQVGSPFVLMTPSDGDATIERLLVVIWNVHVGSGRVVELLEWLRRRTASEGDDVGFVLLLQETYRAGGDIPPRTPGAPIPKAIRPVRPALDVSALGRYLGMSVAYVPSMRNGDADAPDEREDRGSAVLSTEPMSDIRAIELAFGRQRRVAVMATITPRGPLPPVRVVAAHLDTIFGGQGRQAEDLARRISGLRAEADWPPLLMGADTNGFFGSRSGTVTRLDKAIPLVKPCSVGPTTPYLLRFDFVFSTLDPSRLRACQTLSSEYGSDHRPIVLTLERS